jgi:hypothetical protein
VASTLILIQPAMPAHALDTETTNLQLAGSLQQDGWFTVDESSQGADLNGDGDTVDDVLHVQIPGKPVRNTGLAGTVDNTAGGMAFLGISEAGQGRDLNGDGDMSDSVIHVYRPGKPITNLGLAGSSSETGMLEVSEAAQGKDLTGDGDVVDTVAHFFDRTTGAVTNLGLAIDDSTTSGSGILFNVPEAEQGPGGTDLNGDGDTLDEVMHRFVPGAGVTNLGLAGELGTADGLFNVIEASQGASGTDLNGDGDALDEVLHYHNAATGMVVDLGVAAPSTPQGVGTAGALFAVSEAGQAGTDLNGDGDILDNVVHAFTPAAGVENSGYAQFSGGTGPLFRTREADQGQDLNGDGDLGDAVFVLFDFATMTAVNSGYDGNNAVETDGGFLLSVSEGRQGATDFNGDGDAVDNVMFFWDGSGTPMNLGLAGFAEAAPGAFHVAEGSQGGTDINGDGDAIDSILHLHRGGETVNTGLALDTDASRETSQAGSGIHFVVSEEAQGGTVLNGDADIADSVVHSLASFTAHDVGLVDPSTGLWRLRDRDTAQVTSFFYGNPGDAPFTGDWDCDGVATPGLYRQSDGFAYLRNSNTQGIADIRFFFGNPSDIPLAGDFNGDGCDTLSLYRPETQQFFIINALGQNDGGLGAAEFSFLFGNPGDKPVVGDWDGDGIDEVGLHRESTGFFYWRDTLTTGIADGEIFFGDPGDRFVAGDWGMVDGADTPAVFRPSNATFFFRHTLTQGVADSQFGFGESPWLPVAGVFGSG